MPVITTKRSDIHYKDYRQTDFDGVPFVLVHGAGSQYMDYHSKMRRTLNAIALDLPGHGKSPALEPISIQNYANDVVAFIEALNLDKVILVGHSMGGAIAQQIALNSSELLSGLVLIATGANLQVNQTIIDGIVEKPEEIASLVTKWSWGQSIDEKMIQQGVEHLLQTPVKIIQADYIACDKFDVGEQLHTIQTPTLIIAGALDKMTRLAWNQALADNIPNSQLKIFVNNGHQVHVEAVDDVIEVIKNWQEKL